MLSEKMGGSLREYSAVSGEFTQADNMADTKQAPISHTPEHLVIPSMAY
jgi:hypothetical protein